MSATTHASNDLFNLPNQLTLLRLLLSILVFVLMPLQQYFAAVVVFAVAAGTDWVDGYVARKYNLVTQLGRILDPFVDKFLICGTFIYLAVDYPRSGIAAWMAVVVVARELLVTVIRSYLEGEGVDFSAKMAVKLKMVFQCAAVVVSLAGLSWGSDGPSGLPTIVLILAWLAVLSTVYSGAGYVQRAIKLFGATTEG